MRAKLDLSSTNTHFQYSKQRGYCIFKIATLFPGKHACHSQLQLHRGKVDKKGEQKLSAQNEEQVIISSLPK